MIGCFESFLYIPLSGIPVKLISAGFLSENTDIKTTKATVNSCEVIDGKPMKYYFNVETTDNSGNVSSTTSKTFYYDDMNPEISVTPDIVSEEKDYYYNDKVTFKANVKEQFALGTVVYLLNTEDYEDRKSTRLNSSH